MRLYTFLVKKYWPQILIALLIFGGLVAASIFKPGWHTKIAWLEAIAGLGTLLFAGFLWFNGIRREWENSLPKRLTAYYEFGGRNVIVFRNILLFNESDARAWAQQIARQKAGGDIAFEPFFRYRDKGVGMTRNGQPIKKYEISFYLSAIPEKLKSRLGYAEGNTNQKWCIEWHQVEHEDGSITMDELPILSNAKM